MRRALPALLLFGCGVAGRPIPPGPVPPAAPSAVRVVSTPSGLEIHATAPTKDIDGAPLKSPPSLLLFIDDVRCAGRPADAGLGPLRVKVRPRSPRSLRVLAAIGDRRGPPAAPVQAIWRPPPSPPDPPIGFSTPDGAIQIAWLPPGPPVTEIVVLRDDAVVGRAPAASAQFIDRPSRGAHRYAIMAATPSARSAPSGAVTVVAP